MPIVCASSSRCYDASDFKMVPYIENLYDVSAVCGTLPGLDPVSRRRKQSLMNHKIILFLEKYCDGLNAYVK